MVTVILADVLFPALAAGQGKPARMVILMVWDGLRPDSVTPDATPNLHALSKGGGAYLANHHAIFPSLTMVNGGALATAAPPGATGIIANKMYFGYLLGHGAQTAPVAAPGVMPASTPASTPGGVLARAQTQPVSLENSAMLAVLNGQEAFKGKVVEVDTVAERLLRDGGFVGIVGKTGPTFLFDDQVSARDNEDGREEIFVSDDQIVPASLAPKLGPTLSPGDLAASFVWSPPLARQDAHLTDVFIDHVLPAAAAAKRPALLVLWQHNPDATEHADGLGTGGFEESLRSCDTNLGRLRAALKKLQVEDRTDLIIVSDHGFATINMRVDLASLLVAQRFKHSMTSDDVVVAPNFGADEIYLSPQLGAAARTALLTRIVNWAATQPWCGPIFSRGTGTRPANNYTGEIAGTFDQAWFGLRNTARSADLTISFREVPGEDNSKLTGSRDPAIILRGSGKVTEKNQSRPLLHPVMGVAYSDSASWATTGDGTHGALARYEMHNFGAAIGPDFRRGYIDKAPTSNVDVARTIAALLDFKDEAAAPSYGRVVKEILGNGPAPEPYRRVPLSVTLNLPGKRIVTTIQTDQMNGAIYPSDSTVQSGN